MCGIPVFLELVTYYYVALNPPPQKTEKTGPADPSCTPACMPAAWRPLVVCFILLLLVASPSECASEGAQSRGAASSTHQQQARNSRQRFLVSRGTTCRHRHISRRIIVFSRCHCSRSGVMNQRIMTSTLTESTQSIPR